MRQQHPEYGTRRISDVLRRFEALGVSETTVRRILHEEGYGAVADLPFLVAEPAEGHVLPREDLANIDLAAGEARGAVPPIDE